MTARTRTSRFGTVGCPASRSFVAVLCAIVFVPTSPLRADGREVELVVPPSVNTDEVLRVAVTVDDARGLAGFRFEIGFDSELFELSPEDLQRGDAFPSDGGGSLTVANFLTDGTLRTPGRLVVSSLNAEAVGGGGGAVLDLRLHVREGALGPGETERSTLVDLIDVRLNEGDFDLCFESRLGPDVTDSDCDGDDCDATNVTIGLREIAVDPEDVDFGELEFGQSSERVVEISNSGSAVLRVDSIGLSPETPADFSIVSGDGTVEIEPGAAPHLVRLRFEPQGNGERFGTLQIDSNSTTRPSVDVSLRGLSNLNRPECPREGEIGVVMLAEASQEQTDEPIGFDPDGPQGNGPPGIAEIEGAVRLGDTGVVTVYAAISSNSLESGVESWTLAIGVEDAILTGAGTDGTVAADRRAGGVRSGGFESTVIVDPTASSPAGDPQGQGCVHALVLSFTQPITLEPNGTATALALTLESESPLDQRVETQTAFVTWRDGLVGDGEPVASAATVDGGTVEFCGCQDATITFVAIVPQIEVEPQSRLLEFGEVRVEERSGNDEQSFEIRSVGDYTLSIESIEVEAGCSEFSIIEGGGARDLEPGDPAHSVRVRYTPDDKGDDSCVLRVISNAIDEPIVEMQLTGTGLPARPVFRRGDVDDNGNVEVTDAIRILGYLFLGGDRPSCMETADADNNGNIELTDGIRILGYLFLGGDPPPPPGPDDCGRDPDPIGSPLDNGCDKYNSC